MNFGGADASKPERNPSTTASSDASLSHASKLDGPNNASSSGSRSVDFLLIMSSSFWETFFLIWREHATRLALGKKKHFRIAASSSKQNVNCCTSQSTNFADKWLKKSAYVSKSWLACTKYWGLPHTTSIQRNIPVDAWSNEQLCDIKRRVKPQNAPLPHGFSSFNCRSVYSITLIF